jgi:hypothetical protein
VVEAVIAAHVVLPRIEAGTVALVRRFGHRRRERKRTVPAIKRPADEPGTSREAAEEVRRSWSAQALIYWQR